MTRAGSNIVSAPAKRWAPQVSRVLAAAGIPRASRYRAFGYEQDGFVAMASTGYADTVVVAFTVSGEQAREICERAAAAIEAAGYVVERPRHNGVGRTYNLVVTR